MSQTLMLDTPSIPDRPWNTQHIRAPRGDESLRSVPPLQAAAAIARTNQELLQRTGVNVQGRTLLQMRDWARGEVYAAAHAYTSRWVDNLPEAALPEHFFVSGHQPTLFHPGVWVKNFAIGKLADREGTTGLNLVVDNDLFSSPSVRVPCPPREHPGIVTVPFDDPRSPQPHAGARVLNRELFRSFGQRVSEAMAPWGIEPLVQELWPVAVAHLERSDIIADCLTAARNTQERKWGVSNLELPLSRLCELDSFLWFASHLLAHLPRLHQTYNAVVSDYRIANKIRSRTHPVPDLRELEGGWLEAPFWVWHTGDLTRKRVFARAEGKHIALSDGETVFAVLPLSEKADACCAVEVLRKLPEQGIHFRTRALTTTLFARLCFADLFVHGIGGAKYDEMTDRIIGRFFNFAAPEFLTLSATAYLPLGSFPVQPQDANRLRALLRELEYNSDRHIDAKGSPEIEQVIAEKRRLIANQSAASGDERASERGRGRGPGYERFLRFQEIARDLSRFTIDQRQRAMDELAGASSQLNANAVLQDRESSFCLYPAEKLRQFMARACEL